MKPLIVRRKNKEIGAQVRIWTGGKPAYTLGTIVGGLEKRTFRWHYNNHYKKFMSAFESMGYLIKCDNYKDAEGRDTIEVQDYRITFLETLEIQKPRKCPDLKKLLNNLEDHELNELQSLIKELV